MTGRDAPPKGDERYLPVSIRLNPKIVAWAKKEAQRRGIGYQTVINEVLLAACARGARRSRGRTS
jgi:predicted DNA binding CopG/RHH family protein